MTVSVNDSDVILYLPTKLWGVGFAHGQKPQGPMAKAAKLRNLLKLKLLFWQVIGSLVSDITWKLCAVFVHLNHHLFVVRLLEVVSYFSGAFGRSENPMAGTATMCYS